MCCHQFGVINKLNLGFDTHNIKWLREEVEGFLGKLDDVEEEARENVRRGLKRSHESCMPVAKKKRRLVEAKRTPD